MKKTISLILGSLLALSLCFSAYAATDTGERMVTKAELEAAGKGPDSVNWRYQEDYLANKPIPESMLIYKSKTAAASAPAVSSTGEKMVTKSELEAAGKGPDSVNWRYQEDYLANKPIPESMLIYKSKTAPAAAPAVSSTGEKMVTKSELEAAGKGPDSVNWRYQQDYLANKPIPESALIYKPKAQPKASSSSSSSTYTPSSKGLLGDILSPISDPLTSTFDAIFGKGAAENYLKYGHV